MKLHYEDTERFKSKLKKDVEDLVKSFQNWNNPFLTNDPDLIHLTSNKVLSEHAKESVMKAYTIGKQQYHDFAYNRGSVHDRIKQNKLPLFRQKK